MAKMYKVPGTYRKLFRRYISKYFPGEEKEILAKTDRIYDGFKRETHDLGGKKNLLAGNLDLGLAFFAFCEASDMRVKDRVRECLVNMESVINLNKRRIRKYLLIGLMGAIITVIGEMSQGLAETVAASDSMTELFATYETLPVMKECVKDMGFGLFL